MPLIRSKWSKDVTQSVTVCLIAFGKIGEDTEHSSVVCLEYDGMNDTDFSSEGYFFIYRNLGYNLNSNKIMQARRDDTG